MEPARVDYHRQASQQSHPGPNRTLTSGAVAVRLMLIPSVPASLHQTRSGMAVWRDASK